MRIASRRIIPTRSSCLLVLLVFGLLELPSTGHAQSPPAPQSQETLAILNGTPITLAQLPPRALGELQQYRHKEYNLKKSALEFVINQKLLDAEATKKNMTVEQLVASYDREIPEPTAEEIEAYYKAHPEDYKDPLPEVSGRIHDMLRTPKVNDNRKKHIDELRAEAKITVLLESPRVTVAADPGRLQGEARATVEVIEFSDFQCPFCRRAQISVAELMKSYAGKVRYGYRDYPLIAQHSFAEKAAEASRCAEEQKKFWEYHDALFTNPPGLDGASLIEKARELHLDETAFRTCLESGRYSAAVSEDMASGLEAGVNAVPTFFVNGIPLEGTQSVNNLKKTIDEELARTAAEKQ